MTGIEPNHSASCYQASRWDAILAQPGARWRLLYTSPSKGKGGKQAAGFWFPLTAVQKFEGGVFSNGVFLVRPIWPLGSGSWTHKSSVARHCHLH
jgi:hypothetical protein